MAFIVFYDASDQDRQQLTEFLKPTDHYWEFVDEPLSRENLKPEAEMISVFITSLVTEDIINGLPKLRLIACRSTGFNNIDLAAAAKHDITVTNVPAYGEETVAEYTFTLLLALSRKLLPAIQAVSNAEIEQPKLIGFDLHGKTIGIIGAGHIGQKVARIAQGFGMRILAYDPYPKPEVAKEFGFEYKTLEEVVSESDVITLHVPYTNSNRHFINKEILAQCKPGALLINTARGELVDTKALVQALDSGHLGGAGLDVLEGEKLLDIEEEQLLLRQASVPSDLLELSMELQLLNKMPNVLVTPHNAFNTREAIRRINEATVQSLTRYWYGETPYKITPPKPGMGKLLIARHAESEWNSKGVWTGSRDVHLSEKGFREAALFGQAIKDFAIDFAYTSEQIRAFETMESMLDAMQQFDVQYERSAALNERDYGDYTGKNKWEVQKEIGEKAFDKLRRAWDYPVPNGETLKMVYERVVPFFKDKILSKLQQGQTVLLVAHGNSIRSLIKYIENISDDNIEKIEMLYGSILIYDLTTDGHMTHKDIRQTDVKSKLM